MESENTSYFLIRKKLIIKGDMYTIQCMMLCKIYINYVVYTLLKDKLLALFSTVYRITQLKFSRNLFRMASIKSANLNTKAF